MEVFEIRLSEGILIKGRRFPAEHPRFNLLIQTGMCEHGGRYEEFARFLNKKGFDVSVMDAFGQGLNVEDPSLLQRWHETAFEDNVDALALRLAEMRKANGLPTFLMGHSMGSFMSQRFLTKYPGGWADKVVLMGSNGPDKVLMKMGYFIACLFVDKWNWDKPSRLLQSLAIGAYERAIPDREDRNDWLSADKENVARYNADPYCGARNTNGFWKVFLKGMAHLWDEKELKNLNPDTPILLVAGDGDPVGRFGKGIVLLEKMYKEHGVKDVTTILYEGMRHEILNEGEGRHKVMEDIRAFLEK